MKRRTVVMMATIALTWSVFANENSDELRLTPAEIQTLPAMSGGAGTSGLQGIRSTVIAGDPTANGPYTIALQVPANTRIAAHRHRDARTAVVIAGLWNFGFGKVANDSATKALPPGSVYTEPAGVMHFARTGAEGATVYIFGVGPTDTVYGAEVSP